MSKSSKIFCEYDFLEEDSDQERGIDSSEDEIDVILHGTPKQKRKLSRSLSEGSLDVLSSGDEFEKEMELGLEESMKQHEKQQFELAASASASAAGSSSSGTGGLESVGTSGGKYYDDVYFDSDDEDGDSHSKTQTDNSQKKQDKGNKRHLVQSNDDLFYDPEIDDQNQKWVDKQRSRYIPSPRLRTAASANSNAPQRNQNVRQSPKAESESHKSDAILNCPACMTTLCLDCQRHELYPTQYRAMFVLNCAIIRSERLKFKAGQKKKRKWKKKQKAGSSSQSEETEMTSNTETSNHGDTEEFYHPVKCAECNTEVAVYDKDEVYHFFNVLSGIA